MLMLHWLVQVGEDAVIAIQERHRPSRELDLTSTVYSTYRLLSQYVHPGWVSVEALARAR